MSVQTSEDNIRMMLRVAEASIVQAELAVDDATEYLQDDLFDLRARLRELVAKLERDAALRRDREAFAEPSPGLKEWLGG